MARTLALLRSDQVRAQLRHVLVGLPSPVRLPAAPADLAVTAPHCDFLPPPAHVHLRADSQIELLARRFDLERETDWTSADHGPLFAYHLHQQDYLRLGGFTPRARVLRMLDWIERHPQGVGWDPHPISLRLLVWGKLLLTKDALDADASERRTILASMADQAETLRRGLELRLQANHLLSNRIALVWAGLLLEHPRSDAWLDQTGMLIREIDRQIHPDGGHEERSPMYHALLLESLLDLMNIARVAPGRAPARLIESLQAATRRMLFALEAWTHPDGRIALFADSAFGIASEPAALAGYADRLGLRAGGGVAPGDTPSRMLPQTGYARLRSGQTTLLVSLAGPAPAHQPGHAHCDALSFELSFGGSRFVTDTGVYEYVAGARRERSRATSSHATIVVDGEEQAEIWSAHRMGGRPRVEWIGGNGTDEIEGRCCGWSRPSTAHRRLFQLEPAALTIVDRVEGPCRNVLLVLPLGPEWSVELLGDGLTARATRRRSAGIESDGPSRVEITLFEGLDWRIESSPFFPTFGEQVERASLLGEGPPFERAVTRIVALD